MITRNTIALILLTRFLPITPFKTQLICLRKQKSTYSLVFPLNHLRFITPLHLTRAPFQVHSHSDFPSVSWHKPHNRLSTNAPRASRARVPHNWMNLRAIEPHQRNGFSLNASEKCTRLRSAHFYFIIFRPRIKRVKHAGGHLTIVTARTGQALWSLPGTGSAGLTELLDHFIYVSHHLDLAAFFNFISFHIPRVWECSLHVPAPALDPFALTTSTSMFHKWTYRVILATTTHKASSPGAEKPHNGLSNHSNSSSKPRLAMWYGKSGELKYAATNGRLA